MRKIILSSSNSNKIIEIRDILKNMPFDIISKDDMGYGHFDVEEDGKSLEENAFKKAEELHKLTGEIVIADDTGLFVDALNGEPGIYSARYAGEPVSYENNNALLLKNLNGVPMEKRTAYFKTVIAVVFEDGKKITAEGSLKGKIAYEKRGENGFGYDPLFIVEGTGKTFSEMMKEEKNKTSHRAIALMNLRKKLEGSGR
mgnify:CR=1 FL=1|jgi:XTP/dITP diphosphohydrolase